ncbi:UDP-N-acetylmuramyl-tripeptide synthetase [Patescibacteria group bacterium]|nr:UDP-N-acetylmuramyl-tripeptide synthetase [Patescibacteria group bacterium]
MKNIVRKFTPKFVISLYHITLAILANFFYFLPSRKLIVIGVTGTAGKSTAIELIAKVLEEAGNKVGIASTIKFKIADIEKLNDKKMTMLGRFQLQKLLYQMVKAGCQYALVETTSEGVRQFRHLGINYDVLVFTNLFPEHIESHGSFEKYKEAKGKLFKHLKRCPAKKVNNKKIKKVIIANIDDEHANYFLGNWAEEKYGFSVDTTNNEKTSIIVKADQAAQTKNGFEFLVGVTKFEVPLYGDHNVYNAIVAVTVGLSQGVNLEISQIALSKVNLIPGRIEFIDEGQPFKIIVDYAFLPEALEKLYEVVKLLKSKKVIHVLGSAGGGRDVARRPKLGKLAGEKADIVIITNEDPYDEDPKQIINQVTAGAEGAGKKIDHNLFKITDRRKAINKALSLAKKDDVVLITGKGSEQAIADPNGKLTPWDDRKVVRQLLNK